MSVKSGCPHQRHLDPYTGSADLCKKLEADLIKAKDERIASDRTTLIRQIYNNYKRTVTPMHWIALPRLGAICSIPGFQRLVDCPSDSDFLNPDDLAPLAALLPAFVATETERLRRALLDTLSAQPGFESTSTSSPLQVDPLTLAVSVFKCTSSKTCAGVPLLSWVDVASHICKDGSRHGYFISLKPAVCLGEETLDIDAEEHFDFDQRGFEAVHSILHMLGLDPSITTPEDLDNLGPRFVCLECPITGIGRHLKGRHVLSWRQCVSASHDDVYSMPTLAASAARYLTSFRMLERTTSLVGSLSHKSTGKRLRAARSTRRTIPHYGVVTTARYT